MSKIVAKQQYALLKTGLIEPLFYDNGEERIIERDDEGNECLVHDIFYKAKYGVVQVLRKDIIISKSDDIKCLEKLRMEMAK